MISVSKFSLIDYLLFGGTLAISGAIGIFFVIWNRKEQNTNEFLMGSRQMPVIPITLSLLTSFVSGITFLSYPAEIYTFGITLAWSWLGAVLAIIFSGIFILPILFGIRSVSIYQYLQERFESRIVCWIGSILFVLSTLVYSAVVLYAPATALAGVSEMETYVFVITVGCICTLYTALGGLKAVVWTDAFQAIIMYGGSITLLVKGTIDAGGLEKVWQTSKLGGRLNYNLSPDPFQHMTIWTAIAGGFFYWLGSFGANQIALQRYCSLPSFKRAQIVVLLSIPAISLVFFIVFALGLVMFTYYSECDPIQIGSNVRHKDQLVIHFMLDVFSGVPGLPGLFAASLFSATLSTVSSGLNSMAGVTFEDFISPFYPRMSDFAKTFLTRLLAVAYGLMAIILTFAAEPLGGVLQLVFSALGSLSGLVLGLFLLGIFFPWANAIGALVGLLLAKSLIIWLFVGHTGLESEKFYELPTAICGCLNVSNCDNFNWNVTDIYTSSHFQGLDKLYSISTIMFSLIGPVVVVLVGLLVSIITGRSNVYRRKPHLNFWTSYKALKVPVERVESYQFKRGT